MSRWIGLATLTAVSLLGVVLGIVRDPWATRMRAVLEAPTWAHPLGTDELGRDVLARLAHGAPATLGTAGLALVMSGILGLAVGFITGWGGGRLAGIARAFIDVTVALPPLLVALVAGLIAGPSRGTLLIALVAVGWLPFARQADALTATLRREPWVEAHRAVGASTRRLWWRTVLPRILPSGMALALVRLPALVNTVAALGFLGLGPPPPAPEWGAMIAESVNHLGTAPWLLLGPVIALVAVQTILAGFTGRFGRPGSSSPDRAARGGAEAGAVAAR